MNYYFFIMEIKKMFKKALFTFCPLLCLALVFYWAWSLDSHLKDWRSTSPVTKGVAYQTEILIKNYGTIEETTSITFYYHFNVTNVEYSGSDKVPKYKDGDPILVYYQHDDPTNNGLQPSYQYSADYSSKDFILIVCLLVFSLLSLILNIPACYKQYVHKNPNYNKV